MKQISLKKMLQEIAQNAEYNEKYAVYTSRVNDGIYTFTCSPEELVSRKGMGTARETPIARQDLSLADKRQKALAWLWDNLQQWPAIDKAFQSVSAKIQALREAESVCRKASYIGTREWQDASNMRDKLRKELKEWEKKHTFLKGYTVEYLHQTMPANWIKLATA